jgi:hypothetical protein
MNIDDLDRLYEARKNGRPAGTGNTWQPVDLAELVTGSYTQEQPTMLTRDDRICLFYRERIHSITGEPESCKGWLALGACTERLAADEDVLYIDFEDSAPAVIDRLLDLGADAARILRHFRYVRPDEPLVDLEPLLDPPPVLAILDGITEGLTAHGLDLRDNTDIAKWLALLPRPLQRAGAAVVQVDHVTKSRDDRGRWAIGAQHKLAGVDVAYQLEVIEPFGRGRDGLVKILVHKDRPGFVRQHAQGKVVANFALSTDNGVRWTLTAPEQREAFRPTGYMEKVSRAVEESPGLSKRALRAAINGKNDYIDLAVELLLAEGFLRVERDGQARCHYVARAFREAENVQPCPRAPTVPRPCPGHGASNRAPVPPPIRGTGTGTQETPLQGLTVPHTSVEGNDPRRTLAGLTDAELLDAAGPGATLEHPDEQTPQPRGQPE